MQRKDARGFTATALCKIAGAAASCRHTVLHTVFPANCLLCNQQRWFLGIIQSYSLILHQVKASVKTGMSVHAESLCKCHPKTLAAKLKIHKQGKMGVKAPGKRNLQHKVSVWGVGDIGTG